MSSDAGTPMLGTAIAVTVTFTDPLTGAAFDPDPVTFLAKAPASAGGAEASYVYGVDPDVVRVEQGVYRLWHLPSAPGKSWTYRAKGGGDMAAAAELSIEITASAFTSP